MENQVDQERWQKLTEMIMAMASGNFAVQIPRTENNDELEALVALCNMLAQELREIFSFYSYINPRKSFLHLSQMSFYLDKEFQIVNINQETLQTLNYLPQEIFNRAFIEIMTEESRLEWRQFLKQMNKVEVSQSSLKLSFPTRKGLEITGYCFVSKLVASVKERYSVTFFQPVLYQDWIGIREKASQSEKGNPKGASVFNRATDLRTVHKVRDFILEHLYEPLPRTTDLAHQFGTNEMKIITVYFQAVRIRCGLQ